MFSFLKNTNIGARVILALTLPVVGMLAFSGFTVVDKYRTSAEMGKVLELADVAPVISAVVHELQKERGMSAGFIASKGVKFAQELPTQRKLTDNKQAALTQILKGFHDSSFGAGLVGKIAAAKKALTGLADSRTNITGLKITVPQMAGYYTSTIAKFLHIVEEMAGLSTDVHVTNAITSYTAFLQAKERAGIERAMGAGGFGAGQFKPGIYRKFLQLIAMQNTFLSRFAIYASADQKAFLKSTVTGPAVNEVNRMRKIAIESPITGTTEGIDAGHWFKNITQKINLLKKVEDKVAADLHTTAATIESSASLGFMTFGVITVVLLVLTAGLVFVIVTGITRAIAAMTDAMSTLAEGDKAIEIPGTERGDEIGSMAAAVQVFKDNMIKAEELADREKAELKAREERTQRIEALNQKFDADVADVLQSVSSSATQMMSTAQGLSANVEQTNQKSTAVAAASEEASTNVQTVASAAEELSASIAEINQQVFRSSEVSSGAKNEVDQANETIRTLAGSVHKIGEIVELITDIADQTNLLALNATIEAARAGDSGKGFAVVAGEVKNLANQTAKATEEISRQITEVQSSTEGSVDAIHRVAKTISEINEIASAISAAVEEQGAATQEIARNVEQAAAGTSEVNTNISGVNQAAGETGMAANNVLHASGELTDKSEELRGLVETYLGEIKAA